MLSRNDDRRRGNKNCLLYIGQNSPYRTGDLNDELHVCGIAKGSTSIKGGLSLIIDKKLKRAIQLCFSVA